MPARSRHNAAGAFAVPLPGFALGGDDDDLLAALGLDDVLDDALDADGASMGLPDAVAPQGAPESLAPLPDPGPPPPDAFALAAERFALTATPHLTLEPRAYQQAALRSWIDAGGRGMVVLPTGAGKTVLALMAVAHAGLRTLVVVPTIELLHQWRDALVHEARPARRTWSASSAAGCARPAPSPSSPTTPRPCPGASSTPGAC